MITTPNSTEHLFTLPDGLVPPRQSALIPLAIPQLITRWHGDPRNSEVELDTQNYKIVKPSSNVYDAVKLHMQ